MQVRITRSARKHKIGNAHIIAAMIDAGDPLTVGDQLHFVGIDDRGLELHIIAVPDDRDEDSIAVIHAAPNEWRNR
jgi:hypothetical protein